LEVQTIFFDVDGTLLDFRKAEKNALSSLRDFMKSETQEEVFRDLYHKVNNEIWSELEQGRITGEELKNERFHRFARQLDSAADPSALSAHYLNALGKGAFYLENAQDLLTLLKGKYRLAIITNGLTAVQEARFNALDFDSIFDAILISEKEKISKPDSRIFERAAEKIGVSLDRSVLMVGDSLTSDIAGGINAGIRTCWFNPEKWENHSPFKPDYEIHSLMELIEILTPQVQEIERLSR